MKRAAIQHVVLALDELRALGVPERTVQRWAAEGRLHRLYPGVYALVPRERLSREGRFFGAVQACGPGAVLSHRSAADLLGLRRTIRAGIDVLVPRANRCGGHAGIDLHRSGTLTAADTAIVDHIPCTKVARTLLDLAALVRPDEIERALNQADALRVLDMREIDGVLAANRGCRAAPRLRAALELYRPGDAPVESPTESMLLALVRREGLPLPERQVYVVLGPGEPPARVDFMWRAQRLIVETDGQRFHGTRRAFESDRHRDALLVAQGWRVVRITGRQLMHETASIARLLASLLRAEAA